MADVIKKEDEDEEYEEDEDKEFDLSDFERINKKISRSSG